MIDSKIGKSGVKLKNIESEFGAWKNLISQKGFQLHSVCNSFKLPIIICLKSTGNE